MSIKGRALGIGVIITAGAMLAAPAAAAECVPSQGRDAVEAVYETRTIDDAYTEVIDHDAVTETVVITEAWTETIEHPEVTEVREVTPAWTEAIEHPAVYETVVVTEAWVEVIEHPAVVEYVDHDAVYEVEHQYRKQVKTVRTKGHVTEVVHDWQWWSPVSTKWSESDVDVLEAGNHAEWKDKGWNYDRDYRYVKSGLTRQGDLISPPWTETIVIEDAWTETIEHPAVTEERLVSEAWTETIEHEAAFETVVVTEAWVEVIEHPEVTEDRVLVEAWTEVIKWPAAVEVVLVSPAQDAVPAVTCPASSERLADTGSEPWVLASLAAVLLLIGGGLVAGVRATRS